MLQELVNNPDFEVRVGWDGWKMLRAPLDFTNLRMEVRIRRKCKHEKVVNFYESKECQDCGEILGEID